MNDRDTRCIEPGCTTDGLVGINGRWACIDHLDKHLAAMRASLEGIAVEKLGKGAA